MADDLEPWERAIVLQALWNLKLATGQLHAQTEALSTEELAGGMSIVEGIDHVAARLGGDADLPRYGT